MSDNEELCLYNIEAQHDIETGEKLFDRRFIKHPSVEKNLLMLFILVSVTLDPLFFYIPIINNDSNCLGLDNNLRIVVVVLLTFVDGVYILLWWRHNLASIYKKHYRRILSWIAAILAILPVPQVVVYAISWRLLTVKLLKFIVLVQFVPRAYLIIPTYRYARKRSQTSLSMLLEAAFYLLLFILASNVLGAFWYLRAIERNMDCWRKACKTRGLCGVSSLYCDGSSSDNKYLDEFCPIPPAPNSTFFDHGIYLDAFQKDIMGVHTNFLNKFFYCFWWGLQSLSSLGQNLEPATYIWDNLFSIFIVIAGLVLLALLIGNMQVYLQKNTAPDVDFYTSGKRKLKLMVGTRKVLERWPPFYSLPLNLRKEVIKCEDQKWLLTTEINLETLLHNVPLELRPKIKGKLCENLFSKVENFEKLPREVKTEMRKWAKAVVFQARSTIYNEGYPIYEMIHIIEGKALAFNKESNMMEGPRLRARGLKSNDSIGAELLDMFLESWEQNPPLATETVQALTKVEAFVLSFDDIVAVFDRYGYLIPSYQKIWAAKVFMRAAVTRDRERATKKTKTFKEILSKHYSKKKT